jgi:hypothetical protein
VLSAQPTAAAADVPQGVVTPVPVDPQPEQAAVAPVVPNAVSSSSGISTWWAGIVGALALMATAGGQFSLKRRRRKA